MENFGGAWLLKDPSIVYVRGALRSQNLEFVAGMVGTRHGFGAIDFSGAGTIHPASRMYAWYAPIVPILGSAYSDSALVYFSPSPNYQVTAINLKNGTDLFAGGAIIPSTGTPVGASFEGVGARLYAAFHDSAQRGASNSGKVYTLRSAGGYIESQLFQHPTRSTFNTITEPVAGVVTAGVHRFGYLIEYSSGFTTRFSPDSGATTPPSIASINPASKMAAGSKNLQLVLNWNTAQPSDAVAISLVMTTVTNLNQYYIVPGSRLALTGGASVTWTVNIADPDLSSQGIDATAYLYLLTAASSAVNDQSSGASPFAPAHLCLFGDRMAYKANQADNEGNAVDCLYVSDRNAYQSITADQHVLFLPGQRNITTMFRMGTVNYIAGPHEIYAASDNGDVPVTWAAPQLVDGRHGTLAIHGVEVSPSGNYAWIADQSGLYLFTGAPISALAVSYLQSPDWERINWSVAYTLQIRDDAGNKRVRVMAALDSATSPSHIMTWDYTDGITSDAVRYSLDSLSGYSLGAMELVRNDLPGQATANQQLIELWLGPSSGTTYLRQLSDADANPYRDNGGRILDNYRTCPLPGRDQSEGMILMHHGFSARVRGSGSLTPTLYDVDAVRSFPCRTVTLAASPDKDLLFLADLRNELAFIEFASSALDSHWQLAYLKYYYSPYLLQR